MMKFSINTSLFVMLALAVSSSADAGTKVVTFDWEDTTSTSLGEFIGGSGTAGVNYANVTTGMEVDYGPTAEPFDPPTPYTVTPVQGSRMLQVEVNPVDEGSSTAVVPYLAHVINLDQGDVIQYSFKAYDPSDGRSPSVLANGVYGTDPADINSFAGFFTPFQDFPAGTGWLDIVADADPPNADPNLVFDDGDLDDRVAVTLRAQLFRPTLSTLGAGGSGTYKFFIDDMRISVTSENPDASITLPDGSVTLVNASVNGDFDNNGVWECFDVDSLVDEIVQVAGGATPNLDFDLTGDNDVTTEDLTAWLAEAGPERGFAGPILEGDANLDGSVDGPDFLTWNDNKFTSDNLWCGGDFNADGTTDGPDFLIWNENKFQSSDVSAVPEPALGLLSLLGLAFVVRRRR